MAAPMRPAARTWASIPTNRPRLRIRFTRLSNDRHRFEAVGDDGRVETRDLETRSFLLHDLVHFALETAARRAGGFYGQLSRGAGYDDPAMGGEGSEIELVVGALQGASKGEVDAALFVGRMMDHFRAIDRAPPAWLDVRVIDEAMATLRALQGRWRATPFGATMELRFEV